MRVVGRGLPLSSFTVREFRPGAQGNVSSSIEDRCRRGPRLFGLGRFVDPAVPDEVRGGSGRTDILTPVRPERPRDPQQECRKRCGCKPCPAVHRTSRRGLERAHVTFRALSNRLVRRRPNRRGNPSAHRSHVIPTWVGASGCPSSVSVLRARRVPRCSISMSAQAGSPCPAVQFRRLNSVVVGGTRCRGEGPPSYTRA